MNDHSKVRFEKEYQTQWNAERDYLQEYGIKYVFVKEINGISTYKYTKNSELFKALSSFYMQLEK
jgi:hypothetical protein